MTFYTEIDAFKELARLWAADRRHALTDVRQKDRLYATARMSALVDAAAVLLMERKEREVKAPVMLPSVSEVQSRFVEIVGPPPEPRVSA